MNDFNIFRYIPHGEERVLVSAKPSIRKTIAILILGSLIWSGLIQPLTSALSEVAFYYEGSGILAGIVRLLGSCLSFAFFFWLIWRCLVPIAVMTNRTLKLEVGRFGAQKRFILLDEITSIQAVKMNALKRFTTHRLTITLVDGSSIHIDDMHKIAQKAITMAQYLDAYKQFKHTQETQ